MSLTSSPLVEDVLFLILSFCDIAAILAISRSSKYFYRLSSSKSVWLAAVSELVRKGFVYQEDGVVLGDLTKEQLVEKAKRAMLGPRTWGADHSDLGPPIVSREITLPSSVRNDDWLNFEVKLLLGGEYLFHRNWRLDCWSVCERKVVWTYKCCVEDAAVIAFAAQLTNTPDQAVVMTCQRTWKNTVERTNYVEVLTLDLKTRNSQSFMVARVPDGHGGNDPYSHPQICGDFAAVAVATDVMLFNWREGTWAKVAIENDPHHFARYCRFALAPGYAILILTLSDQDEDGDKYDVETIVLSPLAALPWASVDPVNPPGGVANARDLPRVHTEALPVVNKYASPSAILIAVHEHPLRNGVFRIWISVDRYNVPGILSYHRLNLAGARRNSGDGPILELRSATETDKNYVVVTRASFTGHTVRWDGRAFGGALIVVPKVPRSKGLEIRQIQFLIARN
ncbi:hypothetical protein B0H16DRAFT_1632021, partial [Mycena metata]